MTEVGTRHPFDRAAIWVECAISDNEIGASVAFVSLDARSQFLAIEALRTTARAAIDAADVDCGVLVTATTGAMRRWFDCIDA